MNTLNICIGHKPFPNNYSHFIDLFISPYLIVESKKIAVVPDLLYGENGFSLSEYAQLIWLYKHLDSIASDVEYIRIVQYRRFVSPIKLEGVQSTNCPWVTTIQETDLGSYTDSFGRVNSSDLFNTIVAFSSIKQYANDHVLEDLLNFAKYLMEIKVFTPPIAADFLLYENFIPACNIGVFKKNSFKLIYSYLQQASEFLHSQYFILRSGYQRRSVGFLLERLNSYVICSLIASNQLAAKFGHHVVISDSPHIAHTVNIT